MVKVEKAQNNKKDDRITEAFLKSSINSWYADEGVDVIISSVSKVFNTKFSKDPQIAVKLDILSDLPKIRSRVLGEDGKAITIEDEVTGKRMPKVELVSTDEEGCSTVTLFMRLKDSNDDEDPIRVSKMSSCFPLINAGFINSGLIEEGNTENILCTGEDIKEALEGYETTVTVEGRSFNANKYLVLVEKK